MRTTRAKGSRFMAWMYSFLPMAMPAWGPPSSLSPEKQTTSAPARMLSSTVGPWGTPRAASENSAPLPRSWNTGRPRLWPRATMSSRGASSVKPTIWKLLVCTLSSTSAPRPSTAFS